jgi:hypothetical protein
MGAKEAFFNVYNPYFGVTYDTGLNSYNPTERTWEPAEAEWTKDLSLEDKLIVSTANSEKYAYEKLARKALYEESRKKVEEFGTTAQFLGGISAGMVDPLVALPVGYTTKLAKEAYTIGSTATKIALLSTESAAVGMAAASVTHAEFRGLGYGAESSYGMVNLYSGLLAGGLPIIGKVLGRGYQTAKVAKAMTSDPRNFVAFGGELTADALGGTQARSLYNKWAPKWLQSDVMLTAGSDNPYITAISNRLDSPSVAVISRDTGKPVPIGTTGQDYKYKFNGRQNLTLSDIRGEFAESTFDDMLEFQHAVGKTVRDRAVRQEQEVYEEINDAVAFERTEKTLAAKKEREEFLNTWEEDPATLPEGVEPKLKKRTKKEIKAYDEEAELRLNEAISEAIEAKKKEIYANKQLEFEHYDPKVVEAAKKVDEYYKGVLEEGHRLKIHELKHITPDRHYMTRIFDFQKIREIEQRELVSKISKALRGHVANIEASAKEIETAATIIATQLKQLDYTRDWADFSFFVPKELGSTAFLKSKKFKLDDRAIEDILVTDIEDVMGQYTYSQVGHFAANHSFPELQGIPREEQVEAFQKLFIEDLVKTGAKAKEVQALKNMFEDVLGTFRIAKDSNSATWKATRIANNINSLTYGGSFQLNTVAEVGGLLLDGHVKNVMKSRLGSLKEINTMFTNKTIEDPLARDFVLMGQFENLFDNHAMMKFSDTDTVFNVNKVEHNLNKATNAFFKYNGLRGATVALEAVVGPKVIHDILDFSKLGGLSLSQQKYMSRIGLSSSDVSKIAKRLNEVGEFTRDGKIYDMNLDQFSDDLLDKLTTAVERGMRHTVIKGDTTYLPSFMIKPNAFNRVMFQFLRYPMAATETLLARGIDENVARWVAATMTSTFMMASVMYAREQAAIAIGAMDESEAKYNNFWEDEEAAVKLFAGALGKAGTLGPLDIVASKLSPVTGIPMPGHEYAQKDVLNALMGPTFGRLPQLANILTPIFTEGTISTQQQGYAAKAMFLPGTIPFINEYLTTQIKENLD